MKKLIIKRISRGSVHDSYIVRSHEDVTLVYSIAGNSEVNISVQLAGQYSVATIIGVVTGEKASSIRVHTLQHHKAPNTTSNLLIKSVLADASALRYTGSIVVDKRAQKTDAYQRNENLLLGDKATAESSPVLEILANDVRCTHGAIVKTIDESEVWYLSSRGIDTSFGRDMIAEGFLKSALASVCLTPKQYNTIFPS